MIHSASLDILSQLGLDKKIIETGLVQDKIVFNSQNIAEYVLNFSSLENFRYPFFVNLRQPILEKILTEKFLDLGGSLLFDTELTCLQNKFDCVTLTVGNDESTDVPWLVACDGANSFVREVLNIKFIGNDYDYDYVLAEGTLKSSSPIEPSSMFLSQNSVLSFIPMENNEVRIAGPGLRQHLSDKELTSEDFDKMLDEASFPSNLRLDKYTTLRHYKVREKIAESFYEGRVFLCGDAAHIHSPAGGQAMNTGFGDAFSLAWRLSISSDFKGIGDEYDRERRGIATKVIDKTNMSKVIDKMRYGSLLDSELNYFTQIFSQLFHSFSEETSLLSKELRVGARLPNIRYYPSKYVWDNLQSSELILNIPSDALSMKLGKYFNVKEKVKVSIRPDFYVNSVEYIV